MEIDDSDYYSDLNGMVHCGYHQNQKAEYINISQFCDINDRLLCQECYLYIKEHNKSFESNEQLVNIDAIFSEDYRFVGFKQINKQLEQLNNLEILQMRYMKEMEQFYEGIQREVVEKIDICKKKMLCLFNISFESQNIFKHQLEQMISFDSFIYFVRTMSTHTLHCNEIDAFIRNQYKVAEMVDEVTQNYIYSPDMLAFIAQIETIKSLKIGNKINEVIDGITIPQNINQFYFNKTNLMKNRKLSQQIQEIEAQHISEIRRKESLDEQIQQIEKQKQRVMNIQQEMFEECDMSFLPSTLEQSRQVQLERISLIENNPNGLDYTVEFQQISIPPSIKCQIFGSSPLINSQTYEFNLEFLNPPTGEFSVGLVEDNKKNQIISTDRNKILMNCIRMHQMNLNEEEEIRNAFLSSPQYMQNDTIQCNIKINISQNIFEIYNQNFKQTIALNNQKSQTNYRLALQFKEQQSKLTLRLLGVKIIY